MKQSWAIEMGKNSYKKRTDKQAFHSLGGKAGGAKRAELVKKYGWKYWEKSKKLK